MADSNVRQLPARPIAPEAFNRFRWFGVYPRGVTSLAIVRRKARSDKLRLAWLNQEIADYEDQEMRLLMALDSVRHEVAQKRRARLQFLERSGLSEPL